MILSFSHKASGQRVPLLDTEGREVTLNVEATDRTSAINAAAVKEFIATQTTVDDLRVRGVS